MAGNALEGDWQYVSEKVGYKIIMFLLLMIIFFAGL